MAPFSLACLVQWYCLFPSKLSTLYPVSDCGVLCHVKVEGVTLKMFLVAGVWINNKFSHHWVATENPRQYLCYSIELASLMTATAQQVLLFNHCMPIPIGFQSPWSHGVMWPGTDWEAWLAERNWRSACSSWSKTKEPLPEKSEGSIWANRNTVFILCLNFKIVPQTKWLPGQVHVDTGMTVTLVLIP